MAYVTFSESFLSQMMVNVVYFSIVLPIFRIIKKYRIKSHGVKLPGLEFGEDIDLLANMHDVDERKPTKKSKKSKKKSIGWEMPDIAEEHVPLMADLESPRRHSQVAPTSRQKVAPPQEGRHLEKGDNLSDGRSHTILQLVEEDVSSSETELENDQQLVGRSQHSTHLKKDARQTLSSKSADQVQYTVIDHTRKGSRYGPMEKSSRHERQKFKAQSNHRQEIVSSSTVSSASLTSPGSSLTSSATSIDDELLLEDQLGSSSTSGVSSSATSSGSSSITSREASAIVVSETSEEHVPIYMVEETQAEMSHTALMLDDATSPNRGVAYIPSPKRSSSKQSRASSGRSLVLSSTPRKRASSHGSPTHSSPSGISAANSLTGRVSKHRSPSHRSLSNRSFSTSPRNIEHRSPSSNSVANSPSIMEHVSNHGSPTCRSPSGRTLSTSPFDTDQRSPFISSSVHQARTKSSKALPFSPPRSTTKLATQKTSSEGRLPPPPPPPPPPPLPERDVLFGIKTSLSHRSPSSGGTRSLLPGSPPPPESSFLPVSLRSSGDDAHQRSSRQLDGRTSIALIVDDLPAESDQQPLYLSPLGSPSKAPSILEQALARQGVLDDVRRLSSENVRTVPAPKSPSQTRMSLEAVSRQALLQDIKTKDDGSAAPSPTRTDNSASGVGSGGIRTGLLGDIQKLRTEIPISDGPAAVRSKSGLPPPPSFKPPPSPPPEGPPNSGGRGGLLGSI